MKPLTQSEIDAVPMMEGWKIDGIGGLTLAPDIMLFFHEQTPWKAEGRYLQVFTSPHWEGTIAWQSLRTLFLRQPSEDEE